MGGGAFYVCSYALFDPGSADEGSVPEMRIWSILLIQFYFKVNTKI